MNRTLLTISAIFAAFLTLGAAPATQPAGNTPSDGAEQKTVLVNALAPFVGGEWKINTTWKAGSALQARETFEWGPGRKFVICKTFVSSPQGEYQRYHTIFGEQDGKLMSWGFTVDGYVDTAAFTVEGKKFSAIKPVHTADGSNGGMVHQSIELISPNQFRWQVSIEKDGKLTEIMDGTWMRDAVGAVK